MQSAKLKPVLKLFLIHSSIVFLGSLVFRFYLAGVFPGANPHTLGFTFAAGFLFDLAFAIYTFVPFLLVLLILPKAALKGNSLRRILYAAFFAELSIFIFNGVCEFIFFGEFSDRYNFIAVDYLVYTHEVIENIWESYPVVGIFSAVFAAAAAGVYLIKTFVNLPEQVSLDWKIKLAALAGFAVIVMMVFFGVSEQRLLRSANPFEELAAKNGLHALFSAYGKNEIDYDRFYTAMDSKVAVEHVHELLEGIHEGLEDPDKEDEDSIVRNVQAMDPERKLNVVVVVMESLSARFMEYYGNPDKLTPNLDRLAKESVFFDKLYATGTRTVRGLEAILLSIPPTPGQSIVRRPGGIDIFNLGEVFREKGYSTSFLYGGRSTFDGMKEFFEGNFYSVFDQPTFPREEVKFANAWGVSDEDLFHQVVKASDARYSEGKPFFEVVLTTSNHRPYTFPDGRISRKSGGGRLAAIEYSDFAIGEFLNSARTKPWYSSTVFVFVADHNASVSGGTEINPEDYLIPVIVFSPGNLKPQVVNKLASQIDLAPTLLSMLGFSYQSRFFGMDLLKENPNRAFLSTYQKIGYLTDKSLTVLAPVRQVEHSNRINGVMAGARRDSLASIGAEAEEPLKSTVAYYKVASDWFRGRLLTAEKKFNPGVNPRN